MNERKEGKIKCKKKMEEKYLKTKAENRKE